jgi:uncharacterized zinc-type alcohol dehydrogenase-like protein
MLYCGICHSDAHTAAGEFGPVRFPVVTGHELCGRVLEVGANVTKCKVGDNVGVGCMVDSCMNCEQCKAFEEQYCDNYASFTYNGHRNHGRVPGNKELQTFGGYTAENVVNQRFVFTIPDSVPMEKAGPLFCAGITLYDPLKHWGALKGKKMRIGVIGVGGLGTMGIKLAAAMGHDVIAISTSANKEQMAKEKGATDFCVSSDPESVKKFAKSMDLILNTISAPHDVNLYHSLLGNSGTLVQIGGHPEPLKFAIVTTLFERTAVAGSLIGGSVNTQEMINFCGEKGVFPDIEMITADKIDEAWDNLSKSNATGVRYVIDIKKSIENGYVPQ